MSLLPRCDLVIAQGLVDMRSGGDVRHVDQCRLRSLTESKRRKFESSGVDQGRVVKGRLHLSFHSQWRLSHVACSFDRRAQPSFMSRSLYQEACRLLRNISTAHIERSTLLPLNGVFSTALHLVIASFRPQHMDRRHSARQRVSNQPHLCDS
jgi:hypothetical protein